MTATGVRFFKNAASQEIGGGGALAMYDSNVGLAGSSFSNNTALRVRFSLIGRLLISTRLACHFFVWHRNILLSNTDSHDIFK